MGSLQRMFADCSYPTRPLRQSVRPLGLLARSAKDPGCFGPRRGRAVGCRGWRRRSRHSDHQAAAPNAPTRASTRTSTRPPRRGGTPGGAFHRAPWPPARVLEESPWRRMRPRCSESVPVTTACRRSTRSTTARSSNSPSADRRTRRGDGAARHERGAYPGTSGRCAGSAPPSGRRRALAIERARSMYARAPVDWNSSRVSVSSASDRRQRQIRVLVAVRIALDLACRSSVQPRVQEDPAELLRERFDTSTWDRTARRAPSAMPGRRSVRYFRRRKPPFERVDTLDVDAALEPGR